MNRFGWTCKRLAQPTLLKAVRGLGACSCLLADNFVVQKKVSICSSALEACKGAEAIVIATEWKEFIDLPWEEVYAGMDKPAFVFDGRLLVDAKKLEQIGFKVGSLVQMTDGRIDRVLTALCRSSPSVAREP